MKSTSKTTFVLFLSLILANVCLPATRADAQPRAYITSLANNSVSVVDLSTNFTIATIPVGKEPFGVAVNPAGTRVYVTNSHGLSNSVSVIDTVSLSVIATIPFVVGPQPIGVATNPAGTRAYVAHSSGHVSVIDTATNTLVATITGVDTALGVAVTPSGERVYVTNGAGGNAGRIFVIDASSNSVIATIPVDPDHRPFGIAADPNGHRVYVGAPHHGTSGGFVYVIDTDTNSVIATYSLGGLPGERPFAVAVNPSGTRLYVTARDTGKLWVLDAAAGTVLAAIAVGAEPQAVSVDMTGIRVYVTNTGSASLSVIDAPSNTLISNVPVPELPVSFGNFVGPEPVVRVSIDIKPGSIPNSINLGSGGTVPVAIFSSTTFDARTVDPTTVTLASAPVALKGKGTLMFSVEDVDGDGLLDIVVHVQTEALQLSETDTEAVLEGKTLDGTPIRGMDSVRVVP